MVRLPSKVNKRDIIVVVFFVVFSLAWWHFHFLHPAAPQRAKTLLTPMRIPSLPQKDERGTTPSGTKDSPAMSPQSNPDQVLVVPFGSFVSNHKPTIVGSPGPYEQSVCNTTVGARCTLFFTHSSTIKQLPTQVADQNGVMFWNWDINTLGLNVGDWQISAVSEFQNQIKSKTDTLLFQVTQ